MKVKVITCLLDEDEDFEDLVNNALSDGWYLRDTHMGQDSGGNLWIVGILVDDVEPREVRVLDGD